MTLPPLQAAQEELAAQTAALVKTQFAIQHGHERLYDRAGIAPPTDYDALQAWKEEGARLRHHLHLAERQLVQRKVALDAAQDAVRRAELQIAGVRSALAGAKTQAAFCGGKARALRDQAADWESQSQAAEQQAVWLTAQLAQLTGDAEAA